MVEIKVGVEAEPINVVHATIVATTKPGWRVLTPEEIAAGCTGNPDDHYDSLDERKEGMFIGKFLSMLLARFGIIDKDGFCSTYREWHILCRGFYSGFSIALGGKFDKCPDYWNDEAQYYEGGQELGYIVKNGKLYVPVTAIGTLIVTNLPWIMTNMQNVIPFIKSMLGM